MLFNNKIMAEGTDSKQPVPEFTVKHR